jgi:nitrate/nitrite transporter NarK
LFALVACPLWGILSDRMGLRFVRRPTSFSRRHAADPS